MQPSRKLRVLVIDGDNDPACPELDDTPWIAACVRVTTGTAALALASMAAGGGGADRGAAVGGGAAGRGVSAGGGADRGAAVGGGAARAVGRGVSAGGGGAARAAGRGVSAGGGGAAGSGGGAFDVALVGTQLADGYGLDVCEQLARVAPGMRLALLSSHWDLLPALPAGVLGSIAADAPAEACLAAVRRLADGHDVDVPSRTPAAVRFRPYDRAILRLAGDGLTNAEIGRRLHLAAGTVKRHMTELYARLGVRNRAAAVHAARRLGAIPAPATGRRRAAGHVSPREAEILHALAGGATNAEIAAALDLSPDTVKQHASSVYRKLGVRNRVEASSRAQTLGLLTPAPGCVR